MVIFPDKATSEIIDYKVDFGDQLQFGETLSGASVAVTVYSGTDASPSALLSGATTYTSTTASQKITGGIAGVIYALAYSVTGTNSHNYVKVGLLAVVSAANPFA